MLTSSNYNIDIHAADIFLGSSSAEDTSTSIHAGVADISIVVSTTTAEIGVNVPFTSGMQLSSWELSKMFCRYSVYWLYWYKSTNTDAGTAGTCPSAATTLTCASLS